MKTSREKISLLSSRFMLCIFFFIVFLVIVICTLMALVFLSKELEELIVVKSNQNTTLSQFEFLSQPGNSRSFLTLLDT